MKTASFTLAGLAIAVVAAPVPLHAQTKWVVDSQRSLVWWQMNPHFGHLWATSCPAEPTWQIGEGGRQIGGHIKALRVSLAQHEEKRVPLYPRDAVTPVCGQAVRGEIVVSDTVRWRGASGRVAVRADDLINGQEMRDNYARKRVYESDRFPEIRFHLDSLSQPVGGDQLSMKAFGSFEFRGVRKPVVVPVTAVREHGGLRVRGRFDLPAIALLQEFGVSKLALGLGAGQRLWKTLHWGMDLVLRQES